jgi:hypothetical protein
MLNSTWEESGLMQVSSQAEADALRTNFTLLDPLQVISRSLHSSCLANGSPGICTYGGDYGFMQGADLDSEMRVY